MMEIEPLDGAPPAERQHGEISFGLMRIGGALLALQAEAIREVVAGQSTYPPLAAWADGIIGAINLRGLVIPIFDARGVLGMPMPALGDHVILILRLKGRLLGLVADQVCGIARVAPRDLFALDASTESSQPRLATHAFKMEDHVASVLDAMRIAALPNLPTVAEDVTSRKLQVESSEKFLLFTFCQRHFGVEAIAVDATVPRAEIERRPLANGYCLGVIDHQGYATPVLDTSAALGLSAPVALAEASVVVVRFFDNAMLGFAVDEVREISAVPDRRILSMPAATIGSSPFFRGIYTDSAGREHLMLDTTSMREDPQFRTLAQLRKPKVKLQRSDDFRPSTDPRASNAAATKTEPFLIYVAGGERASALSQIKELLPFPEQFIPFVVPDCAVIGLFTHQGRSIPLISTSSAQGGTGDIDRAASRVVVVIDGDRIAGFVVDSLRSIEPAMWTSRTTESDLDEPRKSYGSLVMVGVGDTRRMVPHLDLFVEIQKLSQATRTRVADRTIAQRGPAESRLSEAALGA